MAENLIDIKVEDKEIKRMAQQYGIAKKQLPKVMCGAIRKTATATRTIIKNVIRGKAPEFPSSRVHKRTYIRPKATYIRLSTIVNIALRTIPLIKIKGVKGKGKYRGKKARSSYITWKGRTYPHAFKTTMPSGHTGIFMRKFADRSKPILTWTGEILGGGKSGPGLPIQELGASVGDVFHNSPGVKGKIDREATEKLRVNITNQFTRLIK